MRWEVVHIDETDSTNRWLREKGREDMVVVADYQTAGRGCGTNRWESERGQNLTFSMLLHPTELPARRQFHITEVVSVALCETLERYIKNKVEVKWPNDIYVGDRKICGMLIENRLHGSTIVDSIVGIGLNVNQREFHSDAPNPVSLWQLTGRETDRDELLHVFLQTIDAVSACETASIDYRKRLFRQTGTHEFKDEDGTFTATIVGVLDDGHLVLDDTLGRRRTYAFKEVQFVI